MSIRVIEDCFQFCHVEVEYPRDRKWLCTFIYASPNEDAKRELWEKLALRL